jgi:hypothetical protein
MRVVETKEQTGLDMNVFVNREDKPMRLVFGVLLRGVLLQRLVRRFQSVRRPCSGPVASSSRS